MSVIFSASLFFMSFVPLWISILFIDVKSIVTGGEIRTEVISIIIIVIHAFISGCILWNELRPKQKNGEKFIGLYPAQKKNLFQPSICCRTYCHYLHLILLNGIKWFYF